MIAGIAVIIGTGVSVMKFTSERMDKRARDVKEHVDTRVDDFRSHVDKRIDDFSSHVDKRFDDIKDLIRDSRQSP